MLKCKGHNLSLVVLLLVPRCIVACPSPVPRTKVRFDVVSNNVSKVMME